MMLVIFYNNFSVESFPLVIDLPADIAEDIGLTRSTSPVCLRGIHRNVVILVILF